MPCNRKWPTQEVLPTWLPTTSLLTKPLASAITKKTQHVNNPDAPTHTYVNGASKKASDETIPHTYAQTHPHPQTQPQQFSGLATEWPSNPLPVDTSTPVNIPYFETLLSNHPDPEMVQYLVNGLTFGFDIGTTQIPNTSRPKNHKSALDHPVEVKNAILKELKNGHIAGPFVSPPFENLHCSPLGAREKDDGSYRLIMDLSFPFGDSVNDHISKDDFAVQYTGFDSATDLVRKMGKNCLMFKMDIKHAFRVLPIKPSQWFLMGFQWEGLYFIDFRLPFGLRSSPGIFTRFADAVCWILQNVYHLPYTIHYADDYFFVALYPNSAVKDFSLAIKAFEDLGIPIASEKTIPPTTRLPFLGIIIDSSDLSMCVPEDKKSEVMDLLTKWNNRKKCTKTELLSFTGKLSVICRVVKPGRIFLRRLYDLTKNVKAGHHRIYLNEQSRGDVRWWMDFLPDWSRSTIIPESYEILDSDLRLFTDASKLGFGGVYGSQWIQGRWPIGMSALNTGKAIDIDYLELFAIYAACATWGHLWAGKRIVICTDNLPITDVWQAGSSKSKPIMSLVRQTFLTAANNQFSLSLKYIPGKRNTAADLISRFQVDEFKEVVPEADTHPTVLPPHVVKLMHQ